MSRTNRPVYIEQCPLPRYPWILRTKSGKAIHERRKDGRTWPMYCTSFDAAINKAVWVERSTPRNSRIIYPED